MNSKKLMLIIMPLLAVVAVFFLFRKPWLDGDQEAINYINARYTFEDGKIEEYTFMEKGHSHELGDYLKYYVTFENGKRSIINVYVKLHDHASMIGPDFIVNSCRNIDRDIVMRAGKYIAVKGRETNDWVSITIRKDGTYDLQNYPQVNDNSSGNWEVVDNVLALKNTDGEDVMCFITDGSVLVYQQESDKRAGLLEDGEIFILE